MASASPAIIAPQVGVIKFTKPLAATIVIAVTLVLYPSCAATGAIIGGVAGFRINKKVVRKATEILEQIEELQKQQ